MDCELCGEKMILLEDEQMGKYYQCPNCQHEVEIYFK